MSISVLDQASTPLSTLETIRMRLENDYISLQSMLKERRYPDINLTVILAEDFQNAVENSLARAAERHKGPFKAVRDEGFVGAKFIPISKDGEFSEVVLDKRGLQDIGTSLIELEYLACHEMIHAAQLMARMVAGGRRQHTRADNAVDGASLIAGKVLEEYQAVVLGSSLAARAEAFSEEHRSFTARLEVIGLDLYVSEVRRRATKLDGALRARGPVVTDGFMVLMAHAQAYVDVEGKGTVLRELALPPFARALREAWEQSHEALHTMSSFPEKGSWKAVEEAAVGAIQAAILNAWRQVGLLGS